jgi:hypothetical protein
MLCLYLHPILVTSPIKGILEIQNLTPAAFQCIFWHGPIKCDRHIFQFKSVKILIFSYLLRHLSDKMMQHPLRTVRHFIELNNYTMSRMYVIKIVIISLNVIAMI